MDSSGFSTSRFDRWFDEKYGGIKKQHTWVKAHLMSGVKTNVVTAVEILDKAAGDAPQFPGLVLRTSQNFDIKEVSADKAYSSVDNIDFAFQMGATPFIAFKSNATGASGGLWQQMAGSPQELPPGAPTDPYVPDSGIRLVKSWLRCRDGTLSEPPPQAGAGNAPATVGSDPRKCSNPACDVAAISSRDGPPCIGSGPTLRRCP